MQVAKVGRRPERIKGLASCDTNPLFCMAFPTGVEPVACPIGSTSHWFYIVKIGFFKVFILKTVAYILHQYPVVSFSLTPMHSIGGVWVAISKYARPASSPPLLSRNEPPHGTGRRHPPSAGSAASPPERTPYSCPRFNLLASLAELFEEGTDSGTTVAVPSPQDAVRSASMITVA